jgi:rubrerythrin
MSDTVQNLQVAFAGESQANRKYLAFAHQAEKEGYPQIAKLFRAAADAETIHALAHLSNMGGVGSTLENLRHAVAGETYEFTEMYPGFARTARDEGFDEVAEWFETLAKAEKSHAGRFTKGLQSLGS